MKARMFILAALVAALLVGGFSQAAFAKGGNGGGGGKVRIVLTGAGTYANAKGKADYKSKGGEREFQVEVENIKKLAGKSVSIFVNGNQIGTAAVNSLGAARLNRNSDLGQTVPNIKAGDQVQVKTANGVLIVSGSF